MKFWSTDDVWDCRLCTKLAIADIGAMGFCAVGRVDEAPRANADCQVPPPRSERAALALAAVADGRAPTAPTDANERLRGTQAAAVPAGATCGDVARDGANAAAPPGGVPPFSAHAPAVPTVVSHGASIGKMDAARSTGNHEVPNWEASGRRNGRARWALCADACIDCGLTSRPHCARGLCKRCYARLQKQRKRGVLVNMPATARSAWVRDHDACVRCGTTAIPHDARGLCKRCYGSSEFHKQAVSNWQRSAGGRKAFATITKRYLSSSKGRMMALASQKRRQDRAAGVASDLSAIELWIVFGAFVSRCANCGASTDLCIDHHRPLADGHAITIANAVVLCRRCNSTKKTLPPEAFYSKERLAAIEARIRAACLAAAAIEEDRPA